MLTNCWLKGRGKTCVVKHAERVWSAEIPAQSEYQSGQGTLVNDVQLRISRMVNAGITFILLSALVSFWSCQHWWELWFLNPHSWHTCSFSYSSNLAECLGEACSSCLFLFISIFSPLLLFTLDESRGEKEITVLMESYSSSRHLTLLHTQSKLTMGLIGGAGQAARDWLGTVGLS